LERVRHEKNSAGFLYGKCKGIPNVAAHQYPMAGEVMVFHPDDSMNMPCYVSRWEQELGDTTSHITATFKPSIPQVVTSRGDNKPFDSR
jgi:hypothetical protein